MSNNFEQISIKSGFMKHNGGLLFRKISKTEYEFKTIIKKNHLNAIGITQDNNYIVSFRNFHQLWKIDSKSGKVIWKLGLNGNVKIDSDNYFYAQHAIHHVKGDTLLLFDNGHRDFRISSRALMFRMIDGEFSLIKSIYLPKELYTFKQGSVYLIENDLILLDRIFHYLIYINGNYYQY